MTSVRNLANPESFYELFLLQELQKEEADGEEGYGPKIRNSKRTKQQVLIWIWHMMHREISWETGLTDDQLIARASILDAGFNTTQERIEGSDPPRLHLFNKDERGYVRSDKAAINELQHRCLVAGVPIQVGGFNGDGQWRWFKPVPKTNSAFPNLGDQKYKIRKGRKALLAEPQLDLDEHQALVDQVRGFWCLLFECRQRYKSDEPGYKAIKGAMDGFKALAEMMGDEVCDVLDIPEGSDTPWSTVEPTPPKRIKKTGLTGDQRLDYDTHTPIAQTIDALWTNLLTYRKRYRAGDLQLNAINHSIEGIATLARQMSVELGGNLYQKTIIKSR